MQSKKFSIEKKWSANTQSLVSNVPHGDKIYSTFFEVLKLMELNDWKGACHATCCIIHVLLKEQGIDNELILGEAKNGPVVFNHSWIEIEGEVYDLAIGHSMVAQFSNPPTIKGFDIEAMQPTLIEYGVNSGQDDDPHTSMIKSISFRSYLDMFPGHENGLWGLVENIAGTLGLSFSISNVQSRYQNTNWTFR